MKDSGDQVALELEGIQATTMEVKIHDGLSHDCADRGVYMLRGLPGRLWRRVRRPKKDEPVKDGVVRAILDGGVHYFVRDVALETEMDGAGFFAPLARMTGFTNGRNPIMLHVGEASMYQGGPLMEQPENSSEEDYPEVNYPEVNYPEGDIPQDDGGDRVPSSEAVADDF